MNAIPLALNGSMVSTTEALLTCGIGAFTSMKHDLW